MNGKMAKVCRRMGLADKRGKIRVRKLSQEERAELRRRSNVKFQEHLAGVSTDL